MAKLADAADLKSAGPKGLWGFDSPSRHQLQASTKIPRKGRSGLVRRELLETSNPFLTPPLQEQTAILKCRMVKGLGPLRSHPAPDVQLWAAINGTSSGTARRIGKSYA